METGILYTRYMELILATLSVPFLPSYERSYATHVADKWRTAQLQMRFLCLSTFSLPPGQIVLFTAPEDMVLGQACQLHSREVTSRETAHRMKSSQSLVQSALAYGSQKEKEIKVSMKAGW